MVELDQVLPDLVERLLAAAPIDDEIDWAAAGMASETVRSTAPTAPAGCCDEAREGHLPKSPPGRRSPWILGGGVRSWR